jgi:hypothetical protein
VFAKPLLSNGCLFRGRCITKGIVCRVISTIQSIVSELNYYGLAFLKKEFLATDPEDPGSISGSTRFSEK